MIQTFTIIHRTDTASAPHLERFIKKIDGVTSVSLDLQAGCLEVTYNPGLADETSVLGAAREAGYRLTPQEASLRLPPHALQQCRRQLLFSLLFLLPLLIVSLGQPLFLLLGQPGWPALLDVQQYPLYTALAELVLLLPLLLINSSVCRCGCRDLFHLTASQEAFTLFSTAAALAVSLLAITQLFDADAFSFWSQQFYFHLAGLLLTLCTLARYLEASLQQKQQQALSALLQSLPSTAHIEDIEGERSLPVESIRPGDILVLHAGDTLPVDGVLTDGTGTIDESRVTGEPLPTARLLGDELFAGSVNVGNTIRYRAGKTYQDSHFIHTLQSLAPAAPKTASSDQLRNTALRSILLFGTLLAIAAGLLDLTFDQPLSYALYHALMIFLIALPGALALTTPLALQIAARKGLQQGIFLPDMDAISTARHISAMVFDKTGILTRGRPAIVDILPEGLSPSTLLALAAAAERDVEHPLAKTILQAAEQRHLRIQRVAACNAVPGAGVEALLNGQALRVGQRSWLEEQGVKVSAELCTKGDQLASKGKLTVFVSTGKTCKGLLALTDDLKPEAYEGVQRLMSMGLQVILLTSADKRSANAIARQLGIQTVRAEISPADKAKEISLLQTHGHTVAILGNGPASAAAFSQADLPLSLGQTDTQAKNALAVLLHKDLRDISRLIRLSRKTIQNIRKNILLSLLPNLLCLPLLLGAGTFFGIPFFSAWMALAATFLGIVLVSLHALHLRQFRFFDSF